MLRRLLGIAQTIIILTIGTVALSGCDDDSYGDRISALEHFVSKKKMGAGTDYWFEKNGAAGWERTILVFGYIDDLAACSELVGYAKKTNPGMAFRCTPANS